MFELFKVVVGGKTYTLSVMNDKIGILFPEAENALRKEYKEKLKRELPQDLKSFTYQEFLEYVKTHKVLGKIDWDKFFRIRSQ